MRRLIFALLLILAPSMAGAVRIGTYELGNFTAAQKTWAKSVFDFIVISDKKPAYGPAYGWSDPADFTGYTGTVSTYLDITTLADKGQYLDMVDWANDNGVISEEMLLHAKVDYTAPVNPAWQQVDKFDSFEGAKGIMLADGTDKTTVAYTGASPYTTVNQTLYVGYELPFDRMIFDVRTAAVSLSGTWQYWNGSTWSTLTITDGSSNMTVDGTITFTPPSNWSRTIVNGSRNKYFVRFAFTSASTAPVINTIKGDNWVQGAGNLCRGWDATSGTIVNSGELAYNPTPPVGSAARFRYQARVSTWGVDHYSYHIADFQNINAVSTRTVAAYLAFSTLRSATDLPFTAMMYDDGDFQAAFNNLDVSETDFNEKTANTVAVESQLRYTAIRNIVQATRPDLSIGLNAYNKTLVKLGDWNLYEYFSYAHETGNVDYKKIAVTDHASNMCYDDYTTYEGLMIYQDAASIVGYSTTWHTWDQGNRGPIAALSKHLIAYNPNTVFAYFTNGSYIYSERDEFFYTSLTQTTLAAPISKDLSNGSKQIQATDLTGFSLSNCLVIGSGDTREVVRNSNIVLTGSGNTVTTTAKMYFEHAAGEPVQFCEKGYFSTDAIPDQSRMVRWANYFPAMSVDFGNPMGAANFAWVTGASQGWMNYPAYGNATNTNVWAREYDNALVLHRPNGGSTSSVDYTGSASAPLALGSTYYPLNADGTTGAAITAISLRRAEGAILMKAPVGGSPPPDPPSVTGKRSVPRHHYGKLH